MLEGLRAAGAGVVLGTESAAEFSFRAPKGSPFLLDEPDRLRPVLAAGKGGERRQPVFDLNRNRPSLRAIMATDRPHVATFDREGVDAGQRRLDPVEAEGSFDEAEDLDLRKWLSVAR